MVAALLALSVTLGPPPDAHSQPHAPTQTTASSGRAWNGSLVNGKPMRLKGEHHRFSWVVKKKHSNYGTPHMIALLERAAKTVGHWVPGPPLVLGSISKEHGGKMNPHKSHQAGRDVDILFYVVTPKGKRRGARGFYKFDGAGRCLHKSCAGWGFDVQRNWWLVRTLLWSKRPQIQYIFVSNPLKKLMMDYARRRGEHPEIMKRARRVLAEPGNSSPHADHFHVRIYCSKADRKAGCRDGGPRWKWVR